MPRHGMRLDVGLHDDGPRATERLAIMPDRKEQENGDHDRGDVERGQASVVR